MAKLNVMLNGDLLKYEGVDNPPFDFNEGWAFTLDNRQRSVWISRDNVDWFHYDDRVDDSEDALSDCEESEDSAYSEFKSQYDASAIAGGDWIKAAMDKIIDEIDQADRNGRVIIRGIN